MELEKFLQSARRKIYVTALLDFVTYKKYANDIAWEIQKLSIAEMPSHLIHFDGNKFLGQGKFSDEVGALKVCSAKGDAVQGIINSSPLAGVIK